MKKLRSMSDLMAESIPATPPTKAKRATKAAKVVTQQQLVVQLPADTVRALKIAALEHSTSVRAMLLKALDAAGYPVPAGQDEDRRKVK